MISCEIESFNLTARGCHAPNHILEASIPFLIEFTWNYVFHQLK